MVVVGPVLFLITINLAPFASFRLRPMSVRWWKSAAITLRHARFDLEPQDHPTASERNSTLGNADRLGRYGELFTYDDRTRMLELSL